MPDILIREMEMPRSCSECFVKTCKGRGRVKHFTVERDDTCFLVELPPHGDLIDRSEVLFDAGDVCEDCGDYSECGYSRDQINAYKVIVPASEEDANHD